MTRSPHLLMCLLFALSSCDCENKVRKSVSDRPVADVAVTEVPESSRPQEAEPNDTPELATQIELRQELRPVLANLETASDVDWFALHGIPGPYEISVAPMAGLDISVHLSGKTIDHIPVTYNVAGDGSKEVLPLIFLEEQPTYIGVRSVGSGSGGYEISFMRRRVAGNFESEPNDSSLTSTALELNGEIQGMFDRPDDRDVFVLRASEDTRIRLDFRPVQNLAQRIRIYDAPKFQTPILEMKIDEGRNEVTIPVLGMTSGQELFVEIESESGFDRQAFFTLKSTLLSEISDDIEVEPNDVKPMVFGFPGSMRGGFYSPEDVDRFTIGEVKDSAAETPPSEGKQRWDDSMNLRVKMLSESLRYGITLGYAEGEQRYESDEAGQIEVCGVRFRAGELDLSIRPVEWSATDQVFDYEITTEDLGGVEGFEIEPNDDRESADDLEESRVGLLEGADAKDFYAFEVGAGGDHIAVTAGGKGLNVSIRVEDEEGGLIGESNLDGAALEKLNFDLPEGRYFVVVASGGLGVPSCETYRVNLKRQRALVPKVLEGEEDTQLGDEHQGKNQEAESQRDEEWP